MVTFGFPLRRLERERGDRHTYAPTANTDVLPEADAHTKTCREAWMQKI